MKYSKEKPSDFEWYWYRDENGYEQVVHLFKHKIYRGKKEIFVSYGKEEVNIKEMNGEWAGPIPKPQRDE